MALSLSQTYSEVQLPRSTWLVYHPEQFFATKFCWIPTVINSAKLNNIIAKIAPHGPVVIPNRRMAIPYKKDEFMKTSFSRYWLMSRVKKTVNKATQKPLMETMKPNNCSPVSCIEKIDESPITSVI